MKKLVVSVLTLLSLTLLSNCGVKSNSENKSNPSSKQITTSVEDITSTTTTGTDTTSVTTQVTISTPTSTTTSNGTTTNSNFINFGVDQKDYVDQQRLETSYNVGIYTLIGNCKFSKNTGEQELDGIKFTLAYQLGKSGSSNSKCIQFNAKSGDQLTIYAIVASNGITSANLSIYKDGTKKDAIAISNQFAKYTYNITSNGLYALASDADASINIYGIALNSTGGDVVDPSTSSINTTSSNKPSSSSYTTSQNLTTEQKEKIEAATNVIDWQLDNGGWGKNYDTTAKFNGYPSDYCWEVNNKFVGTIDNKATHTEMRILAEAYEINHDPKFKQSFDKAFAFLQKLQYSTGGFSQIYPHNGKYNDYVTFNDEAMVQVLYALQDIANQKAPFISITDSSQRTKSAEMVSKGVEYIIKAQITVKGEKAAWCAQHNPTTYKPEKARAYELASVSGSESVGVIKFLLTQKNNQQALEAAESARLWLKARAMKDITYSKKNPPKFFSTKSGSYCWYRFYDLKNGEGYFCDRDGKVYTNIDAFYKAAPERATGYDWAGSWLQKAGLYY